MAGRVPLRRACRCGGTCGGHGCSDDATQAPGLQRTSTQEGQRRTGEVPALVHDVVSSPGTELGDGVRSQMEHAFGADFSGVRIHSGHRAQQSSAAVGAQAYTVGRDVVFGPGGYQPGSTDGRRLLAHELAHVVQQQGAGTTASGPLTIDESGETQAHQAAERVAAGGTAGLAGGGHAGMQQSPATVQRQTVPSQSGPPAPSGEQVRFGGLTLSQNPAQLRYEMEQLILHGRPMPMGNRLPPGVGSLLSFRAEMNHFTFAQSSEDWVCKEQPADDWQCRLALKIRPVLDPILDDLERQSQAEVDRFRDAARRNTVRTLDANEKQARAELARYGIRTEQVQRTRTDIVLVSAGMDIWSEQQVQYTATEYRMGKTTPAIAGLQVAAQVLLTRRQAIAEKEREQFSHRFGGIPALARVALGAALNPIAVMPVPDARYFELGREITQLKKSYGELQDVLGAQYPALAAVSELEDSMTGIATLAAGAGPEMAALIGARVATTLANIDKVREGLWDDVNVWRLPEIVSLTKAELGIVPGTIPAALVDEKTEIEKPGILNNLALGALNIVALLLAAPTGGLSLAAAGVVNIGMAAVHVQEYLMAKAMHGSALDQARALSQEDPSLFWLAVEVVGVGVGDVPAVASAAFKTFRILAPLARTALVAKEGKEAATALAELRLAAQELGTGADGVHNAALADNLVTRIGELRGDRAGHLAGLTDDEARLLGTAARNEAVEAARAISAEAESATRIASLAGHDVKLTKSGLLVICTECSWLSERFARELADNPALMARLNQAEQMAAKGSLTAAERSQVAALTAELQQARETRLVATMGPMAAKLALAGDLRSAFAPVLARRPILAQELADLEKGLASATGPNPALLLRMESLETRLAQLREIEELSQAPRTGQIVEVSASKAAAHYYDKVAATVPGPPIVLEFPDGSRIWRDTVGGPIRHEATLGESAGRAGMEKGMFTATEHGKLPKGPKYQRAHSLGQGTGFESPYAVFYAPEYVNQTLQNHGIERYMRDLAASAGPGETFRVVTRTTAHPGGLRLAGIDYSIMRVSGGQAEEVAAYSIRVSNSAEHPVVTAGSLRFSPTGAGPSVAGRVAVPDALTQPASFSY